MPIYNGSMIRAGLILALLAAIAAGETSYEASMQNWRAKREASLKSDSGWLTVAGLFWLKEGTNTAGSDPSSDILLPRGPIRAAVFEYHGGKATFHAAPGVSILLNGKPAPGATELKSDANGTPDELKLDNLTFFVIHRGNRDGIRLKDTESKMRKEFTGLHWFPVKGTYRVTAKFVPYQPPKMIAVPNILGETEKEPSPGFAEFKLEGRSYRLDPVTEDNQLFFIFRDETTGKETYPSGRFLYSELPKDGKVILDFNQAYNPPCAFTPYATCPLPPKENRLAVRIEAGELNYGHH